MGNQYRDIVRCQPHKPEILKVLCGSPLLGLVVDHTCSRNRGSDALGPAIHDGLLARARFLQRTGRSGGIDDIHAVGSRYGILVLSTAALALVVGCHNDITLPNKLGNVG